LVLGDATKADVEISARHLRDLEEAGAALDEREPDAFERGWRAIRPDAAAVLVTTDDGAVELSHANLRCTLRSLDQLLGPTPDDRIVSLLPRESALPTLLVDLLHARTGG